MRWTWDALREGGGKTWPRIGEGQRQIRQIRRSMFQVRQVAASSGRLQVEEVEHGQ